MVHRFIKKCFFTAITFFSYNILNVNSLECVSMNNQECKIKTDIINLSTNEPMFYPYSIKIDMCKASCNTINDPYAKICVPDEIKNTNIKAFNLMSRTSECEELIDKGMCDKGSIWNPSSCECECDKLCDIGEYLDYKNCKCRKKVINKLTEECNENINGNEMLYNETLNAIPLNVYKKSM